MNENIALQKETFRRELRAENKRHDSECERASHEIVLRLKRQSIWTNSQSILFFSALPGEPDLRSLWDEAIASGKRVAFPKYITANDSYAAVAVSDPKHDFAPGQFGIPEPNSSCAEVPLNVLDLILVPGLGFSFAGARLGRGKGYYDRLLASVTGIRCGVAFDWQVVAELPAEAHDVFVDCLVTPTCWRVFKDVR
jgi:5-formyltetrahydrofolate cyclo-ligase